MPASPPTQITQLLEDLGLAASAHLRRVGRHVARLTRQLPQFDSVWLDALAQHGVLTRWQAAEVRAGRGDQLRLGPYALLEPLTDCLYAAAYRARHVDSGNHVRLMVASRSGRAAREAAGRLRELAEAAGGLASEFCALPIAAGQVEQDSAPVAARAARPDAGRSAEPMRLWIAAPWIPGRSAAEWLICHGRMPAAAVLEVARAMAAGLADLETLGRGHGDIAASSVWLADDGRVVLPLPGVRGVLRPEEGYGCANLPPEAYDYLAPERVARGTAPDTASDLYACGCVWWHLLCGRAPLGGGDSLAKLRAAHEARIPDPRALAPDTPAALAEAILACTRPEPGRRPRNAGELAALLGLPTSAGRRLLGRSLRAAENPALGWPSMRPLAMPRRPGQFARPAVMGLALAASLLVAAWPIWRAVREKGANAPTPHQAAARTGNPGPSVAPRPKQPSPAAPSDDRVLPATYLAAADDSGRAEPEATGGAAPPSRTGAPNPTTADLILSDGELDDLERLELRPGQRVAGPDGTRLQVHVPPGGLHVALEDDDADSSQPVRFEGIDFLWDQAGGTDAAMVVVAAENVQFHACTFRAGAGSARPPAAVRWVHPPPSRADALALPSGSVGFSDCLFRDVAAALDSRAEGVLRVEFRNALHLGPGPLVRSSRPPRAEESLNMFLQRVTLRGAAALWRCRVDDAPAAVGRVSIRAERSVFAPAEGGTLIFFDGPGDPAPLLHNLTWDGEGALLTPGTQVAAHRRPGGTAERLDDSGVPIAGLVLSRVEFAGPADGDAGNSALVQWNAPLRTPDPPGCEAARMPGAAPR